MLTAELSKDIDNKWEACWPISSLKPLVLIDCISYLLFFKKLEDYELIARYKTQSSNGKVFYSDEPDELCWHNIKDLDAKNIHTLFTKENGIEDLLKNYANTDLPFSHFLKAPLLIKPSAVLLKNVVEIVKILESEAPCSRGIIFEYLLHKKEIQTAGGQFYAPVDIINTIVSFTQPSYDEIICDPSCGNGDFLVSAASYISNKYGKKSANQFSKNVIGIDDDPIQLRIAAMNMILHGIQKPRLIDNTTFKNMNFTLPAKPALIISNLFFTSFENNPADTSLATENRRKDINLLKIILKNLEEGGRAALIIRNYILSNNLPEVKLMRQQLVDNYKIDAVINLPDKTGSAFSGASILIFNQPAIANNDKIWFYEMKPVEEIQEIRVSKIFDYTESNIATEENSLHNFQGKFENDMYRAAKIILSKSFCVPIEKIKNNNYNLVHNQFKKNTFIPGTNPAVKNISEEKKDVFSETRAQILFKTTVPDLLRIKVQSFLSLTGRYFLRAKTKILPNTQGFSKSMARGFSKSKAKILLETQVLLKSTPKLFLSTSEKIVLKTKEQIQKISVGKKQLSRKVFSLPKTVKTVLISAVVLGLCTIGLFSINRSKSPGKIATTTKSAVPLNIKTLKDPAKKNLHRNGKKMLTKQQIKAILNDTSGIIHFEDLSASGTNATPDSPGAESPGNNRYTGLQKQSLNSKAKATNLKYTVTDTAYFHDKPNENTARKVYLDPLRKAVLTSLRDSNGFIYIVYTNKLKIISRGWINKKYLKPVQ